MKFDSVTRRHILLGIVSLSLVHLVGAAPYDTPVQNNDVWHGEWQDAKRARKVPVKIYFPQGKGPFPVIMFSHGLGGSKENYEYLGDWWAEHGYVSVHLQHIGTDDSVWKGKGAGAIEAMRGAVSLKAALDRPRDVSFAIDQLQTLNKNAAWPLHGKLDLTRIGMAGHSFGSNTTLLVSGLAWPGMSLSDTRVKCAIAMSAPPPAGKNYAIYDGIKIPMLHMTGTNDVSPFDPQNSKAVDRRIPYDHIDGADGYLVTFAGGDHMLFSGRRAQERDEAGDARNHALILQASTPFWDAYLKGDTNALAWLRTDFAKELGTSGVFEQKSKKTG